MTTALDLIKGALRRVNSYQSGEPISPVDEADCLETLNDMLDSWSLDKLYVFGSNEWILQWTAQKRYYTVGNPTNAQLSGSNGIVETAAGPVGSLVYPNTNAGQTWPNISGTIGATFQGQTATNVLTVNSMTSGALFVGDIIIGAGLPANTKILTFGSGTGQTGTYNLTTTPGIVAAESMSTQSATIVTTSVPSNLIAGSTAAYTTGSGSILQDSQALIPINTTVLAIGATAITMSANATGTSQGTDSISYTIPGDFPIPRPLRISGGFTRFNTLDFTLDVAATQAQYTRLLYKAQSGPWPTLAWYNNTFPYGILNAYQQPGNGAELHLFVDTILANMALNQTLSMPQGYARAIKWNLAKEICGEFGFPISDSIKQNAQSSLDMIKALNALPAEVSRYDRALSRGNRADGGWVLTGGMR
jgi:hypothetical protein